MYARDTAAIATPVGIVGIDALGDAIVAIRIGVEAALRGTSDAVRAAADQLEAWFAGDRQQFDLTLAPCATQRGKVLRAGLIAVGYGETASYGDLAQALASSPRAIGQLCARNPLPIIVPCHRIIAAGGALGPYSAGGGTRTKRWLIAHEQAHCATGARSLL